MKRKIFLKDTECWTLLFMLAFEEQLKQNEDFIRVRQIIRARTGTIVKGRSTKRKERNPVIYGEGPQREK